MDFELFLAVEGGGSDGYNGLQAEVRLHDAQLAGPEQFWRWVKGAYTSTDFLRERLSISYVYVPVATVGNLVDQKIC
jgi:hypothetical protein